jgi:hypothetical protein
MISAREAAKSISAPPWRFCRFGSGRFGLAIASVARRLRARRGDARIERGDVGRIGARKLSG